MLNKRISKESMDKCIITIGNISCKFTEETMNIINTALEQLKKYKNVYRALMIYIAILMLPQFASIGGKIIIEMMYAFANFPLDIALFKVFGMVCGVCKYIILTYSMIEIIRITIQSTKNEIKCRLNK